MKDSSSIHSPAIGLTDGFGVGGSSTPGMPSVHPDISMVERGAQGSGTSEVGEIGGVGSTRGAFPFAQTIDKPSGYTPGDGDSMVGGMGTPPKP